MGTDGRDLIVSGAGRFDKMKGDADADRFVFGAETSNGRLDRDKISYYEIGLGEIVLGLKLILAGDGDMVFLKFVDDLADVSFINEGQMVFA
ncbi:hypothetical protein [Limimaricola cinnabarinus]|uniref:Peptidase M10 serralysin C-terminal domain-containing protein n=1 Tax=Limimaricola cinnabarinus TaxID=1125964 RepID=A0A2G1ME13_9RHOB|nr:hypothetical protein [Limimaricola cinnabarinus]PHP26961.1 hypothetical protein CJ301_13310 [Limimaricola cinnabarinus]